MISKDMYKTLKRIPRFPKDTNTLMLLARKTLEVNLLFSVLEEALSCKYVMYSQPPKRNSKYNLESSPFCLTEAGQLEIEEYENRKRSSAKSTWAIIISIFSFIVAALSLILKFQGVQ